MNVLLTVLQVTVPIRYLDDPGHPLEAAEVR